LDALERKKERQLLEDQESEGLKSGKAKKEPSSKVTRSQIENNLLPMEKKEEITKEKDIVENVNKLTIDGEEARTVDDAISVLRYVLHCSIFLPFASEQSFTGEWAKNQKRLRATRSDVKGGGNHLLLL
jgi:hypothetical protein